MNTTMNTMYLVALYFTTRTGKRKIDKRTSYTVLATNPEEAIAKAVAHATALYPEFAARDGFPHSATVAPDVMVLT